MSDCGPSSRQQPCCLEQASWRGGSSGVWRAASMQVAPAWGRPWRQAVPLPRRPFWPCWRHRGDGPAHRSRRARLPHAVVPPPRLPVQRVEHVRMRSGRRRRARRQSADSLPQSRCRRRAARRARSRLRWLLLLLLLRGPLALAAAVGGAARVDGHGLRGVLLRRARCRHGSGGGGQRCWWCHGAAAPRRIAWSNEQ